MNRSTHISVQLSSVLVGIITLSCTMLHYSIQAQDIHFSQFFNCPYNMNPAFAGQFEGAYRFVGNQRTQWRSVTTPYSTFGFGADARNLALPDGVLNKKDGFDYATGFHAGISFFHDKAGDSQLTSNQLNLTAGKDYQVGNNPNTTLSGALMLGYTQMQIDYSQLRYDNQWNGLVYDPGISPEENYARESRGYLNLNAGILFRNRTSHREEWTAGVSVYNIGSPPQSFFDDGYVKLDMRMNLQGTYKFPINETWLAEPMLMGSLQGTYAEVNFGGLGYYITDSKSYSWKAIYFGGFGRARDAGYVVAGMQYNEWNVGLSYDINTSNLRPASNGRGGFEIAVIYIVPPKPKPRDIKVCPDYF
jgi:type IX secretion system PorP/SprF family membrane protein